MMSLVYNRKRCGASGTTACGGVGLLVEDSFDDFLTNRRTAWLRRDKTPHKQIQGKLVDFA